MNTLETIESELAKSAELDSRIKLLHQHVMDLRAKKTQLGINKHFGKGSPIIDLKGKQLSVNQKIKIFHQSKYEECSKELQTAEKELAELYKEKSNSVN